MTYGYPLAVLKICSRRPDWMNGAVDENDTTDRPNGRQTRYTVTRATSPVVTMRIARPVSRSHAR